MTDTPDDTRADSPDSPEAARADLDTENSPAALLRRGLRQALGTALESALDSAQQAGGVSRQVAGLARDAARQAAQGLAGSATDMLASTGEGALRLAQLFLSQRTLTLPLPEPLLNLQIRQRMTGRGGIDHLSLGCGDDSLRLRVDGHYQRLVYTVDLQFAVIECRVSARERYLRLQQVGETLDVQLRQGPLLVNWATRQLSRQAFKLANNLPLPSLVNHVLKDIPGIHAEAHRRWRIDLDEAGLFDGIASHGWMLDSLREMTDFSALPGLQVLHDSRDLLQRLANQLEVRSLRVQPGRLEVGVGLGTG